MVSFYYPHQINMSGWGHIVLATPTFIKSVHKLGLGKVLWAVFEYFPELIMGCVIYRWIQGIMKNTLVVVPDQDYVRGRSYDRLKFG